MLAEDVLYGGKLNHVMCDVQTSLSSVGVDGRIPCSKCVQGECRSTYVNFHRQTAAMDQYMIPLMANPSSSSAAAASSVAFYASFFHQHHPHAQLHLSHPYPQHGPHPNPRSFSKPKLRTRPISCTPQTSF
ncbi:hypothetical protein L218DRAFT_636943 [Marasmius fiardii PR-910]|nr:hypothetical protein L218DRAFT_636943 [Marasmius fiardii PR-910]